MATSKKAGSSSESSGSSTDSEAEGTGDLLQLSPHRMTKHKKHKRKCLILILPFSGMIKQQKKKGQSLKDTKKTQLHNQSGLPPTGLPSQPAGLQSSSQLKQQQQQHQPSPAGFIVPPVAALESSQLLETSFESLPPFGQPLMHLTHHTGNSSSPAPPHLNTHPAGPVSPETHPFLNQHPILPSPGKVIGSEGFYLVFPLHNS